jgi:hypothetical protein
VGFQEQFCESVHLKLIIVTAGYIRFIYFRTWSRTGQERLDNLSWNVKTLSNKKLHCLNLQGKTFHRQTQSILSSTRTEIEHCAINLRNGIHNTLKLS